MVSTMQVSAQEGDIFWIGSTSAEETRGNAIFRYSFDGGTIDTLVKASDLSPNESRYFIDLAFDPLRESVVWTDTGYTNSEGYAMQGAIMRVSRSGGNPEPVLEGLVCGIGSLSDIEVDPYWDTLYWGQASDCPHFGLWKSVLSVRPPEPHNLETSGNYAVGAVELHHGKAFLYWSNNDFFETEPHGILRAPVNRAPVYQIGAEEYIVQESVCDFIVSVNTARIFWTPCETSVIRSADLDGNDVQDLLISDATIGKMTIDEFAEVIYWTEPAAGKIKRANLDGSSSEVVLSGLNSPGSLKLSFGEFVITSVEPEMEIPQGLILNGIFPNPLNSRTTIDFEMVRPGNVVLEVYDVLGRRIDVLANGHFDSGRHEIDWAPTFLSDGVYFSRIEFESAVLTQQFVIRR